ncbi:hypothetical protein BGZ83_008196 [Gryganskiella cystojenkinii]|nr:hypothetical protein BGZ83_008196 [Gryganskiella cystojenkinii]
MVDSGLRTERDEDGIGNELRFERWFDLVDKMRLNIPEEQCLAENEEEWNDLVARHHALIGKTPEKRQDKPESKHSFAFNYGTSVEPASGNDQTGSLIEVELTAMEEDNILDHLDDLTPHERDILDTLGQDCQIDDYYRMLRRAKRDQDARVSHLRVTAVNLERAMAGKKPLKASEIEGTNESRRRDGENGRFGFNKRRRRRGRSASPHRRSSPSYEPYSRSSSRSGSESPERDSLPFLSGMAEDPMASNPPSRKPEVKRPPVSPVAGKILATKNSVASPIKLSLAEKLKQRMRQGLDLSIKSNELKKQAKEKGIDLSSASREVDMGWTGSSEKTEQIDRIASTRTDEIVRKENESDKKHTEAEAEVKVGDDYTIVMKVVELEASVHAERAVAAIMVTGAEVVAMREETGNLGARTKEGQKAGVSVSVQISLEIEVTWSFSVF